MNSKLLAVVVVIITAGILSLAPLTFGQQSNTASLTVKVPVDAKLYFDGTLMGKIGASRTFVTPPLNPGSKYSYTVKAEIVRAGQVLTGTKQVPFQVGQSIVVDFAELDNQVPEPTEAEPSDAGWPRKMQGDYGTITIYQPQVESWEKNLLTARAAVAVEGKASPQQSFGVVWFTARTDVDREHRHVTLADFNLTKVSFPSAPEKDQQFSSLLKLQLPAGSKTVSLDRLEASLAVTEAESKVQKLPLKNEPPRIFFTTKPAVLVLIDGQPVLRPAPNSKLLRVINTRALLLFDQNSGLYYMHFVESWLQAKEVEGPWSVAANPPASLDALKKSLANAPEIDLLDDPAPDLKAELEKGIQPEIHVSTVPAELLELEGEPDLAPIDGTKLLYVKNTTDEIVLDTVTSDYYALLSGRWFKSNSLQKGPWEFVPGDKLPPDVAKIPENHPLGDVLSAVTGTVQAKEAVIANHVPQTATIKRSEAKLSPMYDGDPKFEPIEDTQLNYAANSATPVIQVAAKTFYAVENGVWFMAADPVGPWTIVDTVPAVIYTIPPSSPIYYVTNVQVYGGTPDVVYVGYTPGYFGSCLSPWGTVVYGTGWNYRPWVGRYWYGRSWTYGYAATFRWSTAGGWGFGFGAAVGRPWGGPLGWNAGYGGVWRAGWQTGFGGRYTNVHATNIHVNNFNVYNRWPTNTVAARRTTTSVAAVQRTNVVAGKGLNSVYAGSDGLAYKKTTAGWTQQTKAGTWNAVQPMAATLPNLNNSIGARNVGAIQTRTFQSSGGFAGAGGINAGGFSGYRGVSGAGVRVGGVRRR